MPHEQPHKPHDLQSRQREAADLAAARRQIADLDRRLADALDSGNAHRDRAQQAEKDRAREKAALEQKLAAVIATAKKTKDVLEAANATLASRLSVAENKLREADGNLLEARTKLTEKAGAIEELAHERDRLVRQLDNVNAEDRDLAKLRRRLQEQGETLERTRVELARAKAKIPPAPLVLGGGMPEPVEEVGPAETGAVSP